MTEHSLTFREFPSLLMELTIRRECLLEELAIAEENEEAAAVAYKQVEVNACEWALREAVTELIKKADGVAAFIRSEEAGAATAKAESDRCYNLAKARKARADLVKAIAIEVMQQLGKKVIQGEVSELRRWGNGGPHPVQVRQPELLPAKYQRWELNLSGEELEHIADLVDESSVHPVDWLMTKAKPVEEDIELIRKDLMVEGKCPSCGGAGNFTFDEGQTLTACDTCNGKGKVYIGCVPGAVLVPRAEHLRIR